MRLANEIRFREPGDGSRRLALQRVHPEARCVATERVNHHDNLRVPDKFEFNTIGGLSNEMVRMPSVLVRATSHRSAALPV